MLERARAFVCARMRTLCACVSVWRARVSVDSQDSLILEAFLLLKRARAHCTRGKNND